MRIALREPANDVETRLYLIPKEKPPGGWLHLRNMAGPTRLELATSGVTGLRSNQLNYDPAFASARVGGRWGTRTHDPLRVRQVL